MTINFSILKKTFVINLALLLFLNLLVKPFWIFGIDRTVQNVVGANEYGFYFVLFNFSLVLNIILDLGITNYNNKNIAQHTQLLSKYVSNIVSLKFLLAIIYIIITVIAAIFIGYKDRQLYLLYFLGFNQILMSFILYLRSNISGLHLFKTDSFISVLDRILMIIIVGILLWGNVTDKPFKIEWFVYSQTAAYLFTVLITFLIVLSKTGFLKFKFNLKFFIVFLKQSYPYAILILLMAFYNRIDSIMLERLLSDNDAFAINNGAFQAGIYAQAFRILDAFSMFAFLFAGLLLPMFARMIKEKESIVQLVQLSSMLLIVPAITIVGSTVFYRYQIMELMYHNHADLSANIFGILISGFIGISTTYIFGTLLTANGSLKQLNIMASFGMILNVVLNLVLVPELLAQGSAIASFATQTLTALAQVIIAVKVFKFNINYRLIFSLIFYGLSIWGLGFITTNFISDWVLGFFTMLFVGAILAFGFKLISIKALINIIKYDKK